MQWDHYILWFRPHLGVVCPNITDVVILVISGAEECTSREPAGRSSVRSSRSNRQNGLATTERKARFPKRYGASLCRTKTAHVNNESSSDVILPAGYCESLHRSRNALKLEAALRQAAEARGRESGCNRLGHEQFARLSLITQPCRKVHGSSKDIALSRDQRTGVDAHVPVRQPCGRQSPQQLD